MKQRVFVLFAVFALVLILGYGTNQSFAVSDIQQEIANADKTIATDIEQDAKLFGEDISNFYKKAIEAFKIQREQTIQTIQECRENSSSATSDEKKHSEIICRQDLQAIRNTFGEIRGAYKQLFKDFGEEGKVLIKDIRGEMSLLSNDRDEIYHSIHQKAMTKKLNMDIQDVMSNAKMTTPESRKAIIDLQKELHTLAQKFESKEKIQNALKETKQHTINLGIMENDEIYKWIEGKTVNPTLSMDQGSRYFIHIQNPTDEKHRLIITEDGKEIASSGDILPENHAQVSVNPTLERLLEYHCEYHPNMMKGAINVLP